MKQLLGLLLQTLSLDMDKLSNYHHVLNLPFLRGVTKKDVTKKDYQVSLDLILALNLCLVWKLYRWYCLISS